jgi:hypothetical protein
MYDESRDSHLLFLRLMESLMREFLSRNTQLLIRFLGFCVLLLVTLWLFQWNLVHWLQLAGLVLCMVFPFLMIFGIGRLIFDDGRDTAAKSLSRKSHLENELVTEDEPLNYDGHYTIGDDGELIELSDADEKRNHDDSRH